MLGRKGPSILRLCQTRQLSRASTSSLQHEPLHLTFGSIVLQKSPQQERIHGPADWRPQLRLADPLKPCDFRDFTLQYNLSSVARNAFHPEVEMLPCVPPWWDADESQYPEEVKEVLHLIGLGSWDLIPSVISRCLSNDIVSKSFVFWEFLLWQSVRVADEHLGQTLITQAAKRLAPLRKKLTLLYTLVLLRTSNRQFARHCFTESDLSATSLAQVEFVTNMLMEATSHKDQSIRKHFFSFFPVKEELVAAVDQQMGASTLPDYNILCYAIVTQNITLLMVYLARLEVTGKSQQANRLLVTVTARFLPPDVSRKLWSQVVINTVLSGHLDEAAVTWLNVTERGRKLSCGCTGLLLKLHMDKRITPSQTPDFSRLLMILSRLHCVSFAGAPPGEIAKFVGSVGQAQAIMKNYIGAGGRLSRHAWHIVYNKLLPIDVAGTFKWHTLHGNAFCTRVLYAVESSDLRGNKLDLSHVMRTDKGGLPAWGWRHLTPHGLYPLSFYAVTKRLIDDCSVADQNIEFTLNSMVDSLSKNSLESYFVMQECKKMATTHILESSINVKRLQMNMSRILKTEAKLIHHFDVLMTTLRLLNCSLPPTLMELILDNLAPKATMDASPLHARCTKEIWLFLQQGPDFRPTVKLLHHTIMGVAKHDQPTMIEVMKMYPKHKLQMANSTLFAMVLAVAAEHGQLVTVNEIVEFGRRNGAHLTQVQTRQIQTVMLKHTRKTNMDMLRSTLALLKQKLQNRPRPR